MLSVCTEPSLLLMSTYKSIGSRSSQDLTQRVSVRVYDHAPANKYIHRDFFRRWVSFCPIFIDTTTYYSAGINQAVEFGCTCTH